MPDIDNFEQINDIYDHQKGNSHENACGYPAKQTVIQAREDDTLDMLCTLMDDALYKAKKTDKNRCVVL